MLMLFFYQTIIKFPWWSTMSRNSTIMLTHYAWPPNPLFDAIKFISTGNRSLLVFFFFLFFFFFSKNFESRNLFPSIVEVFSSREIRPPISSLRFGVNTLANKWKFVTQIPSMHQTISNLKPFLIEMRSLSYTGDLTDSVVKQKI